jgi:hypothetical protein
MLARTLHALSVAAFVTLFLTACASTAPAPREELAPLRVPPLTPTSRVYDAERISRSGAITAWDAVRLLVPRYRLETFRGGSPSFGAAPRRGRTPWLPLVLDGHPMLDFDPLRAIPAGEVIAIHVLSASEASQYFVGDGGQGAIVVQTRASLRGRRE